MPAGSGLSPRQQDDIDRAIRIGEQQGRMRIAVYVGPLEGGTARARAMSMHAALGDQADGGVLIAVDPQARAVEIVTGRALARRLSDRDCALATATMTSSFAAGDLGGGIVDGIRSLAEHARAPETLHTDEV
ncbi:MAG: DUF5130 family protein [Actinomycetes bacterium]